MFSFFSKPKEPMKQYVNRAVIRASNGEVIRDLASSPFGGISVEKYGARTVIRYEGFWSDTIYEPSLGESVEYEVW